MAKSANPYGILSRLTAKAYHTNIYIYNINLLNAYKCPRFLPRDIFIVQSGMISLRITSERFVRCVEGTLGSCPKRLRRRSSIKGTSSGWRRMAINQINHLAIGSQMFQRKPPQMITLPKANVQQNSLKIPKGKIVSQPPFLRGYVRFREGNYFSTYLLDRRQKDNNLATVEYTKLAKYSGVPVWDPQILRDCVFSIGTPQSLAWNLEMMVSNRNLLFQGLIFRCHVKLQ